MTNQYSFLASTVHDETPWLSPSSMPLDNAKPDYRYMYHAPNHTPLSMQLKLFHRPIFIGPSRYDRTFAPNSLIQAH